MSRICRQQNHLDGSNNYREAISQVEPFSIHRRIKIVIISVEKRSPRVSIDSYLSRFIEKLLNLIKTSFSKRRNTHRNECNQASYSTKDPSNMLSSQKHLSKKKKNAKHSKIQNTHTYTLNKANQFYISKTSQDSLVSIH